MVLQVWNASTSCGNLIMLRETMNIILSNNLVIWYNKVLLDVTIMTDMMIIYLPNPDLDRTSLRKKKKKTIVKTVTSSCN